MKTHELKVWKEPFQAMWEGRKTFELRVNDRDFKVEDILILNEWDEDQKAYRIRRIHAYVTHILYGSVYGEDTTTSFGLPAPLCIMSLNFFQVSI